MNVPLVDPITKKGVDVFSEKEKEKEEKRNGKVDESVQFEYTELSLYDYKIVSQFEINMPEWQHNISKARELIQAYITDGMPTPEFNGSGKITSWKGCLKSQGSGKNTCKGCLKSQDSVDEEAEARAKHAKEIM